MRTAYCIDRIELLKLIFAILPFYMIHKSWALHAVTKRKNKRLEIIIA